MVLVLHLEHLLVVSCDLEGTWLACVVPDMLELSLNEYLVLVSLDEVRCSLPPVLTRHALPALETPITSQLVADGLMIAQ